VVRGLDALDGTPVLDIKPYSPEIDCIPEATGGWHIKKVGPDQGGRREAPLVGGERTTAGG